MRYQPREIAKMVLSPLGRLMIRHGLFYRAWPALRTAASFYRRTALRNTRIVTVVGSYGKTTTARVAAHLLGVDEPTESNCWSFLARQLLDIRSDNKYGVIEAGINGPGQMSSYADMIRPDITVVTSIGSEHNTSLKDLDATRKEKAEMVRALPQSGTALLNGDDPNVLWMKDKTRARVITFGTDKACDVRATDIELDWPDGTRFVLSAYGQTHEVRTKLIGPTMVTAILGGAAVALTEGLTLGKIADLLQCLTPTIGRLEPVRLDGGAVLLCDYTKGSYEPMVAALDLFSRINARRRIVVLGDIFEPPDDRELVYGQLGKSVARVASMAFFLGDNFHLYAAGAKLGGLSGDTLHDAGRSVKKASALLRETLEPGDAVLIKGRKSQHLERIAYKLAGRTVACDAYSCISMTNCTDCPMLERGWNSLNAFFN